MDISIKTLWEEDPYLFSPGNGTSPIGKDVWAAQVELMSIYHDKGKLPQWRNFSLMPKENQTFIRELLGFLEEEIIEAQSAYEELVESTTTPTLGIAPQMTNADFNEEVADALHFWVELFIFIGITHEDIVNYYHLLAQEQNMNSKSDDIIKMALQFANSYRSRYYPTAERTAFVIPQPPQWIPYEVNCLLVGNNNLTNLNAHTFQTIKHLQIVKNHLKNKYWKAKENYQVDTDSLRKHLLEAWVQWTVSLSFTGYEDSYGMVYTYLLKNRKNKLKAETH